MALPVLMALGLIAVAFFGFVAIVTLVISVARTIMRSRGGELANEESPVHIVASTDERNPYAPTSTTNLKSTSQRKPDFGQTAFMLFAIFGMLLTCGLILAFTALSWRWLSTV